MTTKALSQLPPQPPADQKPAVESKSATPPNPFPKPAAKTKPPQPAAPRQPPPSPPSPPPSQRPVPGAPATAPAASKRPEFQLPDPPVLRFTPTAWAKLQCFCHCGDTEIGGFGITSSKDLLLVE